MLTPLAKRLTTLFPAIDLKSSLYYASLSKEYEYLVYAVHMMLNGDDTYIERHLLMSYPYLQDSVVLQEKNKFLRLIPPNELDPIVIKVICGKPIIFDGLHRFCVSELFNVSLLAYIIDCDKIKNDCGKQENS